MALTKKAQAYKNAVGVRVHISPGDWVIVHFVKSNICSEEKRIGWYAYNVKVKVEEVYSVCFTFFFNNQKCYELIEDAKKVSNPQIDLFQYTNYLTSYGTN